MRFVALAAAFVGATFLVEAATLATPPSRIVSLAPVATEFLFALGVGDRVVGVTSYCDRPNQASSVEKIGGFSDPQLEAIIKLKPDLVVATPFGGAKSTVATLETRGIQTLSRQVDSLADMKIFIQNLGDKIERPAQAAKLWSDFEKKLAQMKSRKGVKSVKVLVLISASPLIAASPATFPGEIISHLGMANFVKSPTPSWPILSLETLLSDPPDIVVVTEGLAARTSTEAALARLLSKHKRIRLIVPAKPILQRPGPYLIEDIEALLALFEKPYA